jgi:hypothetical protein
LFVEQLIGEISPKFLASGVAKDMAGTGFINFDESEHRNRFLSELRECDVPCLNCCEKVLCLLLNCLLCTFYIHFNYQIILKTDQLKILLINIDKSTFT